MLAAGVVTSAIILSGAAVPLAFVGGLVAWGARVAMALPRGPRAERIDPFRLGDPWRRHVQDATQAQRRFQQTVRSTRTGPLREALDDLAGRIDDGVRTCWRVAQQGNTLDDALTRMDMAGIRRELAELAAERGRYQDGQVPESLDQTFRSVDAQRAAGERLASVAKSTDDRLRLLNAQLDESVARAIELSVSAADVADLAPLTEEVNGIVGQLEALRQGLEEVGGASAAAAP